MGFEIVFLKFQVVLWNIKTEKNYLTIIGGN